MIYQRPQIHSISYEPVAQGQYFSPSPGGSGELPGSATCAVELGAGGIVACLGGSDDFTNYRIIVQQNDSPIETVTIGVECTASPGTGDTCQVGDTTVFCVTSLIFNGTDEYTLQLQKPSPDDTIISSSPPCPITPTLTPA